jgi:hypothetical protein
MCYQQLPSCICFPDDIVNHLVKITRFIKNTKLAIGAGAIFQHLTNVFLPCFPVHLPHHLQKQVILPLIPERVLPVPYQSR